MDYAAKSDLAEPQLQADCPDTTTLRTFLACCTPPAMTERKTVFGKFVSARLAGAAAGVVAELLALVLAFISAGAGHGSYIGVRLLFPFSSLLILVEGGFGPLGLAIGLLQYPVYGACLAVALATQRYRVVAMLLATHVIAVVVCFSGVLSDFI